MRRSRSFSGSPSLAVLGGGTGVSQGGLAPPAPPVPGAHPSAEPRPPGAGAGWAGVGRSCAGAAARRCGAGLAGLRPGGGRGCGGRGQAVRPRPRCPGGPRSPPPSTAHMEPSKLPTTPGASPAVGCRKQGLFMLQMMPWSQGRVPAEGSALLGKWPAGEGETGLGGQHGTPGATHAPERGDASDPPAHLRLPGLSSLVPPRAVPGPRGAPTQRGGPRGGPPRGHRTLTLVLLEGRVGLPHRDQDEEEEEGPQELDGQLDLGETHGRGGGSQSPSVPGAPLCPRSRTQRLRAPSRPGYPLTRCRRR